MKPTEGRLDPEGGGAGLVFEHHASADATELAGPRAEVEALLSRLGNDIATLDDGGDAASRQALADAAERFNTASAEVNTATTLAEISVARAVAVEGLHATRLVRSRLGLDPGTDPSETIPSTPSPSDHPTERHHSGLAGVLGAGVAGGLLGLVGGNLLGEVLGEDGGGGADGDWGGDWGGE